MNKIFNDLIIFEMANNHQGNLEHGVNTIKKLAKVAKKHGLNAGVKFQYRDLDTFVHPDYVSRNDVKHIPRFMATRLSDEEFLHMANVARCEGLITICTPFDEVSVDKIVEHNYDILKIASCSALDWPLLEKASSAKLPLIVSTGGKSFTDMDKIYNFFTHRKSDFAMLHCIGMYPAKPEDIQLNCMKKMIKRYYNVPIGYSGHENPSDYEISRMAVASGAVILERHVGLETDVVKLNAYSTNVDNIELWIQEIKKARDIMGGEEKLIINQELVSLNELQRGTYLKREIMKGDKIFDEDVFFAMPLQHDQMTSGEFKAGIVARRNYNHNEPLYEKVEESIAPTTRSLIHQIKGQLFEAKIYLGNDVNVELSHQYGIEKFEKVGATIVDVINREYCKKILVLLPGQFHPVHHHKIKEETFQVLSGVLELQLEGENMSLQAGDIVTVYPCQNHSFSSKEGCVFEEVSTTHKKGDSYYEDKWINSLDVIARKTLLESW